MLALLKKIDGARYRSTTCICNDIWLLQSSRLQAGPVVVEASALGYVAWLWPHPRVK